MSGFGRFETTCYFHQRLTATLTLQDDDTFLETLETTYPVAYLHISEDLKYHVCR